LKAFDKVYVVVANNSKKKYLFTVQERIEIILKTIDNPNVIVEELPVGRLVGDYAKEKGACSIIKGIRNLQDMEYERMLHEITVSQESGVDTFVMFSDPKDQKISSSAIKELISYNADVRDYIPLFTKQMVEIKQNHQHIIGLTGSIACGKSYIAKLMSNCVEVDMDKISNDITYGNCYDNEEILQLRKKIMEMLNITEYTPEIVKPLLKEKILHDYKFNTDLQDLYKPMMIREIRKQISGKVGLIVLNGALLIDADMQYLCNNNIILVDARQRTVVERLDARYGTKENPHPKDVLHRIYAQFSNNIKLDILNTHIESDNHGICVIIKNEKGNPIFDLEKESDKTIELIRLLKEANFNKRIGLNI
jgi:pantetheine-phosphate adenylyltransferase